MSSHTRPQDTAVCIHYRLFISSLSPSPLAPFEGVEWFPAEASPGSIAGRSGPGRVCASQAAIFAQLSSGLMMRHSR